VKAGWQTRTLEEVCQFSNGLWKGEKPPFLKVGVIRNTNFNRDGSLDDSDIAYLDVEAKKLEKRRLQFGDIILEKSGGGPKQAVGRVALFNKVDGDFSFSNFTSALRVRDPKALDFRFLHRFLFWMHLSGVTEGMQSHSTGIRNLDGDAYKAILISYPPLLEQQRIVAILDEAFEGITTAKANAEKNLQNARELFKTYMRVLFSENGDGWNEKRLGDVADLIDCLHRTPSYVETGFPMVRVTDIKPGVLNLSNTRKVDKQTFVEFSKKHTPKLGDIVFSRVGSYGVSSFVNSNEEFCLGQNTIFLVPKINPQMLYYFLNSPIAKDQIDNLVDGTTQPTISMKSIREIKVPVPPLTIQQKLVQKLDQISSMTNRLEEIFQQKAVALDEFKQSLLHRAFNGDL